MSRLAPGEFRNVGAVVEPGQAIALGASLQELYEAYRVRCMSDDLNPAHGLHLRDSRATKSKIAPFSNAIYVGMDDAVVLDEISRKFAELSGSTQDPISLERLVFAGVAVPAWHSDSYEAMRALINLSAISLKLEVATDWNPENFVDEHGYIITTASAPPAAYETIEYGPGEALLVNNVCDPRLRKPHRGLDETGKVLLRLTTVG